MNHLCMSTCEAIKAVALKGWSGRRIARELAVNRETVARYLGPSKLAIPPLGSSSGGLSLCEVHLTEITLAIVQGLSAQRIYQNLVTSHAFAGSQHRSETHVNLPV
jgi:hypothetical protein